MNKGFLFLFLIVFVLSACVSQAEGTITPTQANTQIAASTTPTLIPVASTQRPTNTPEPSGTPTVVPSVTSTFDVASIVTSTSSAPQDCPVPANVPLPDLSKDINNSPFSFSPSEEEVIDYLNAGGNPSDLIATIRKEWKRNPIYTKNEVIKDLTGDAVPEILVIPSELYIFGCQDGKYQILFKQYNEEASFNSIEKQLAGIQDMNLDGIPEIVIADFSCGGMGSGQCLDVHIYEWDGNRFVSLFPEWEGYDGYVSMIGGRMKEYLPDVGIKDVDNNGTKELILTGDIPNEWYLEHFDSQPWRDKNDIYKWNGRYFVLFKTEFSPPQYRYQAVQDGDRSTLWHEYDKALTFYQDAIFKKDLLGWSPAHKERFISLYENKWNPDYQLTPTPVVPPDDPLEYPNLAAYARYRIILLHLIQGNDKEAQVVYDTLKEKFPEGSSGYEFTLIASAVWDEYQSSKDIKSACARGIAVANEHQGVLKFLGSDYHNYMQDIMYEPKDVCPFK